MLLVKEAVYLDLLDTEHAINEWRSYVCDEKYIHLVAKSRVGVPHELTCQLATIEKWNSRRERKGRNQEKEDGTRRGRRESGEEEVRRWGEVGKEEGEGEGVELVEKEKKLEEEAEELTSGSVSMIDCGSWAGEGAAMVKGELNEKQWLVMEQKLGEELTSKFCKMRYEPSYSQSRANVAAQSLQESNGGRGSGGSWSERTFLSLAEGQTPFHLPAFSKAVP